MTCGQRLSQVTAHVRRSPGIKISGRVQYEVQLGTLTLVLYSSGNKCSGRVSLDHQKDVDRRLNYSTGAWGLRRTMEMEISDVGVQEHPFFEDFEALECK